ncbi:hypothetical protein [Sandaracinobacteroides hominis]|uniref:hypothetical protein n=1 Tax=Sandaracinobacteroides hominis TaxID=2780086 RepID=UPI0018F5C1A6|nr:hypothetical protein [Sandaracinobacteroides hominis]
MELMQTDSADLDPEFSDRDRQWPLWGHMLLCAAWIALLAALSSSRADTSLFIFFALLFVISAPAAVLVAHRSVVRRTMLLASLKPGSTLPTLLRGYVLRTLIAIVLAVLLSVVLAMSMLDQDSGGRVAIALICQALFIGIAAPLAHRWTASHFQPWSQIYAVRALVVPAGAVLGAAAMMWVLPLPEAVTLSEAVDSTPFKQSAMLESVSITLSVLNGVQVFALEEVQSIGGGYRTSANLLYFLQWIGAFWVSAMAFTALGIRWREMRRAFSAPDQSSWPPRLSAVAYVGILSCVAAYWATYNYGALRAEALASRYSLPTKMQTGRTTIIDVYRIGEELFPKDVVMTVIEMRPDVGAIRSEAKSSMCKLAKSAFDGAERSAKSYVDQYYTMPAEYMRLGYIFTSKSEQMAKNDMTTHIFGDSFAKQMSAGATLVNAASGMAANVDARYVEKAKEILGRHKLKPSYGIRMREVGRAPDLQSLLIPPSTLADPQWKAASAVSAALLAQGGMAVIGNRVSAKVFGSQTVQTFTSKMAKRVGVGPKSAAVVAGSTKSVVRGATAVAGAAAGTVAGVAATKAMLEADEYLHRAEFEAQILKEVRASRDDYLQKAGCLPVPVAAVPAGSVRQQMATVGVPRGDPIRSR